MAFLLCVIGAFLFCRANYLNPEWDFWGNTPLWLIIVVAMIVLLGIGFVLFAGIYGRVLDERKEERQTKFLAETKEKYADFVGQNFLLRVEPSYALV